MKADDTKEFPGLSLMEGGPGDALMRRLRLIRPEMGAASARTAVILAALTWFPLLVFSVIEGLALSGATIPFLYDLAAHTRFLLAVPMLLLAEIPIGRSVRRVAGHFLNAGLICEKDRERFSSLVFDTARYRNSRLAHPSTAGLDLRYYLRRAVEGLDAKRHKLV